MLLQVWKEAEGDFDERTTDDWDVDMSVYYDEAGGDKDARDALAMRNVEMKEMGKHRESVFKKPSVPKKKSSQGEREAGGSSSASTARCRNPIYDRTLSIDNMFPPQMPPVEDKLGNHDFQVNLM